MQCAAKNCWMPSWAIYLNTNSMLTGRYSNQRDFSARYVQSAIWALKCVGCGVMDGFDSNSGAARFRPLN